MNKKAFTLAEVLITLGIIGIVAAMTMPTLIQKHQERETVTALKKFYSSISQAYQFVVQEYGAIENWGLKGSNDVDVTGENATEENKEIYTKSGSVYMDRFAPYLKLIKRCKANESSCFAPVVYKDLTGSKYMDMKQYSLDSAIMSDGMVISFEAFSSNCSRNLGNNTALQNVCGSVFVDINGLKGPNTLGKDMFSFYMTKHGIIPRGTSMQEGSYAFENNCRNIKTQAGFSCAAWVIYNENLDYLHCNDLSWDGKKKCK